MFLHSEHMTFAQKVIECDNDSGKKIRICRNRHKWYTEFSQKKIGIESDENNCYSFCVRQKKVIENGSHYIPK